MTKKNDLDKMLSNASRDQIRKLKRPRNIYKLQRMLTKEFCNDCRRLAMIDSSRPYSDYCSDCQEVANKVLGGILK